MLASTGLVSPPCGVPLFGLLWLFFSSHDGCLEQPSYQSSEFVIFNLLLYDAHKFLMRYRIEEGGEVHFHHGMVLTACKRFVAGFYGLMCGAVFPEPERVSDEGRLKYLIEYFCHHPVHHFVFETSHRYGAGLTIVFWDVNQPLGFGFVASIPDSH